MFAKFAPTVDSVKCGRRSLLRSLAKRDSVVISLLLEIERLVRTEREGDPALMTARDPLPPLTLLLIFGFT